MNENKRKKRIQTDIKSAQGMVAMSAVLNLIFSFRAIASGKIDFYFGYYITTFFIKGSELYPELGGSFSKLAAIVAALAVAVISIVSVALITKNFKAIVAFFVFYLADTAFMAWGLLTDYHNDFSETSFIDVIFHGFVIAFVVVGLAAFRKSKKIEKE